MPERLTKAEAFLQEAVYQSRGRQAAQVGLQRGRMEAAPAGPTNCGLGREAAIELSLSPRAVELSEELWPAGCDAEQESRIGETMRAWCERQDQLDRDRNHFLKAFRKANGFDRTQYSAEQTAEYEAGLNRVNEQSNAERREHAQRLL